MPSRTQHTDESAGANPFTPCALNAPARSVRLAARLAFKLGVLFTFGWVAIGCSDNPVGEQSDLEDDFVYVRSIPAVTKAVLDPGSRALNTMLTRDLEITRALGVNTVYVYVDYSYYDGEFRYTQTGRFGETAEQQGEIEEQYIDLIKLAKQTGFAVHLAIAFGGGANTDFGVSVDQFFADARAADLKWAAVGEPYKVESFAPSSEVDFQIFREYFDTDWNDEDALRQAAELSNEYHTDILPALRNVFDGRLIFQAGLYSPYLGSPGYDVFGTGVNSVGAELDAFRDLVPEILGYAQTNAERQGSDWMVTELWLPTKSNGTVMQTPSGTPYSEIRPELFEIAFDEYQKVTGLQPIGLAYTSEFDVQTGRDTESEAVISSFFNGL